MKQKTHALSHILHTHLRKCHLFISSVCLPESVCVAMVKVVVEEAWQGGGGDSQGERRNHITSLKQIRMIAHLHHTTMYNKYGRL